MKSFRQFMEQPEIVNMMKGFAQQNKMTKGQATNLKDKINSTVFDKLTGGAEGREKGINKSFI